MDDFPPYEPCPCGSGRKYKFCCRGKRREGESSGLRVLTSDFDPDDAVPADVIVGDLDESRRLCDKGLKYLGRGEYKQAIPYFRRSIAAMPAVYTPANNLALCLYATGELDEAIRVQKRSLAASPLPNPFGLCNLATFHLLLNQPAKAQRRLDEARRLELPSVDACIKVCETLARFKRHRDILETADACPFDRDPNVAFFTGVAAANLDQRERAIRDLRRVTVGHPKADMVTRYLDVLRTDGAPHTVMGDWPYLLSCEICPSELLDKLTHATDSRKLIASPTAVHLCEAFLNEDPGHYEGPVELLSRVGHPDAKAMLWRLVKGTFGPDGLRVEALTCLQELGEVEPKKGVEVWIKGERRPIAAQGIWLNGDYRFGGKLPSKLDKIFARAVEATHVRNPDWSAVGDQFRLVMEARPDFYPARFNYAVSLVNRGRADEAEPILRDLTAQHPVYLFAPGALLQLLMQQNRMDEAGALVKSVDLPEETHPDAMAAWVVAQTLFHVETDQADAARACIGMAYRLLPKNPMIKRLWSRLGGDT